MIQTNFTIFIAKMFRNKIILLSLFIIFGCAKPSHAQNYDSVFFDNVKAYLFHQFGDGFRGNYYTKWDSDELPYYIVFASRSDSIVVPSELKNKVSYDGLYFWHNSRRADSAYSSLKDKGYPAFIYKTWGMSNARLSYHLVSYPKEAICFVIFHELMHNYIFGYAPGLPYEFNEAASDVLGNYGSISFATWNLSSWQPKAREQIKLNESLYEAMDTVISQINRKAMHADSITSQCNKKLKPLIAKGNSFQRDRFGFDVNNAYLLKNSNYCVNYFLLKEVYLKQKSVYDFLQIIRQLHGDPDECRRILRGYL